MKATEARPQVRAAIYARLSVDKKGERVAVDRQVAACEALAEAVGWTVVERLDDNDLSAMSGVTRPGFEALLDNVKRREIDAILCWQPDRLYRSRLDLSRLLELGGVQIKTVNGGDLDLSNATGRMLAGILGSVATQESELKGERQRAAAQGFAESGKPKWRRAFGYVPDTRHKEDDDGTRKVDPEAQRRVRAAYEAIAHGDDDARNITKIAESWNAAGITGLNGQPWSPSTMSLFLRSPRNAGLREYGGEILRDEDGEPVKGTWPALVDEQLWRDAQVVLSGNVHGPKSVQKHLLTGVLQCGKPGCGGHLSGNWVRQAGNQAAPKAYALTYACKRCRGVSVRAEHAESLVMRTLVKRLSRTDAAKLLRKKKFSNAEAAKMRAEENALLARLDAIGVERGLELLTGRQAKLASDVVQAKLDALTKRQQDQSQLRALNGIPVGTDEAGNAVEALTPDRYRAVLDALVTITVAPVGKGGNAFNKDRIDIVWKETGK